MSARAVFLDRDGVINDAVIRNGKPYPPADVSELAILPGVQGGLERLKRAGFLLIVVTNQPDVARGTMRRETAEAINSALRRLLPIDEFRVCFHDDGDRCDCRKPKPGMLFAAAAAWDIDLARSYMIGDRWRDVDAGNAAGCSSFLVDHSYAEQLPAGPFRRVASLSEAADLIVKAKDVE